MHGNEQIANAPLVIGKDGSVDRHRPGEPGFLNGWQPVSLGCEKDEAESQRVGRLIRAAAKCCWFNARKVVMKVDAYKRASYVEGWAVLNCGLPIEHGWVVRDGKIIDPTLPWGVAVYLPGLEFQGRDGIKEFLATPPGKACKHSPFFYAFGWGGCESPTFRKCYEAAMASAQARVSDGPLAG